MKVTTIVIFGIVTFLILIPTIAELKIEVQGVNNFSNTTSHTFTQENMNNSHSGIYTPPNYGAPNSEYGSGTR